MNRYALPLALLTACSSDFSVNVNEDASSSSGDDSSSSGPSSEGTEGTLDPDSTSSAEDSSSSDDTLTSDTSEGSSSDTGCDTVEDCFPCSEAPDPDGACAAEFPDRPLCGPDGLCVACTAEDTSACTGTSPVCDTGSCVGCTYHDQCSATACNMATGACFDDTCVTEVDGDGDAEFTTITAALGDGCVIMLHEREGDIPYTEVVDLDAMTVALLAASGERPRIQGVGGGSTVNLTNSSALFMEGIDLRGNTESSGLEALDSEVYVDRVQIVQNSGSGIVAEGSHVQVRNSFISGNGDNFSETTGIAVTDCTIEVTYATVVFNDGDGSDSFQCVSATGSVRNSIVIGADMSSFDCPGVTASYTAFDDTVAGDGNENVAPAMSGWFVNPASNFHLTSAGETVFEDVALWIAGDPANDIDGTESRPSEDSTADVAGADVLP